MKKSDAGIQASSVSSIHAFEVALLISIKPPERPRVGRFYGKDLKVYTLQALLFFHWLWLSHTVTLSCRGSWETWPVTPGRERSRLGEPRACPPGTHFLLTLASCAGFFLLCTQHSSVCFLTPCNNPLSVPFSRSVMSDSLRPLVL